MPNEDACQPEIIAALEKDGWIITDRQVYVESSEIYIFIDLEAMKVDRITYIEVKCFPGASTTTEFYAAVGQYCLYREVLNLEMPGMILYLAIPAHVYDKFGDAYRNTLSNNRVKIILVDLGKKTIIKWIE
jgi:hypothetical protein